MTSAETQPESVADLDGTGPDGTDLDELDVDASGGDEPAAGRPTRRLGRLAVGAAVIGGEQLRGGITAAGGRTVAVFVGLIQNARDQTVRGVGQAQDNVGQARERLRAFITDAERRGRDILAGRREETTTFVGTGVHGAVAWAQVKVVPRVIDGLMPHLISDVVPRLIDGALPEIRARVVPVLIEDLTADPRVRELIMAQGRGMLGQVTDQLRTGTARADDRFEAAAHRVIGRGDKAANGTSGVTGGKGANEIRGG